MSFDSALTSGELEALRGTSSVPARHKAEIYLSVCPNTVVYSGRVNMSTFDVPVVEVTYDGGSGTLADVVVGMTILFSHTSDKQAAYLRSYVRTTPTSSIFYIGANGDTAEMQDNDYIWVLYDFAIHEKLPRDVAGYPVPDWDTAFRRMLPRISNLRSAYAEWVDDDTGIIELSLTPTVEPGDYDATTSFTYLWTVPSGVLIHTGSTTTKNVTLWADPGFYWVHFKATDSNGNSLTRHISIWAHDPDLYPPQPLEFGDLEISCEIPVEVNQGAGEGYNATVRAFEGVDDILDNTLICAWTRQKYNGTEQNIGSAGNILMVGRLRNEQNQTDYRDLQQDMSVFLDIDTPLQQLAARRFPAIEISRSTAPTTWNQVESLTYWRAIWLILTEYSTFASLHSVSFFDTSEVHQLPVGYATQGGDLLNSIAELCQSVNAVFQDNTAGMIHVGRRDSMTPTADRSSIPLIADLGTADHGSFGYSHNHFGSIGSLRGSGGGLNTGADYSSAYDVRAPRFYPASGAGEAQLPRQVLIANQATADERAELEARAGHGLAASRNTDAIRAELSAGYHFLTPAVDQRYTFTFDTSENLRGRSFGTSTYWWLQSKRIGPDPVSGEIKCECIFVRETSGTPGSIIDYPLPVMSSFGGSSFDLVIPPLAIDTVTGTVDLSTGVGGVGSYGGGKWNSACSGGRRYLEAVFPLGDIRHIASITVTYSADASVVSPASQIGVVVEGSFRQIVDQFTPEAGINKTHTTPDLGGVAAQYIYVKLIGDAGGCTNSIELLDVSYNYYAEGEWSQTFDYALDSYSWSVYGGRGSYSAGTGFLSTELDITGDLVPEDSISIIRSFAKTRITSIGVDRTFSGATDPAGRRMFVIDGSGAETEVYGVVDNPDGRATDTATGDWANITGIRIGYEANPYNTASITVHRLIVTGRGVNPFL